MPRNIIFNQINKNSTHMNNLSLHIGFGSSMLCSIEPCEPMFGEQFRSVSGDV